MTVARNDEGTIVIQGECGLEQSETLLRLLLEDAHPVVDWRSCTYAHTAIVQLLMMSGAELVGPASSHFLSAFVEPALMEARARPRSQSLHQGIPSPLPSRID